MPPSCVGNTRSEPHRHAQIAAPSWSGAAPGPISPETLSSGAMPSRGRSFSLGDRPDCRFAREASPFFVFLPRVGRTAHVVDNLQSFHHIDPVEVGGVRPIRVGAVQEDVVFVREVFLPGVPDILFHLILVCAAEEGGGRYKLTAGSWRPPFFTDKYRKRN